MLYGTAKKRDGFLRFQEIRYPCMFEAPHGRLVSFASFADCSDGTI